MDAKEKSLEEIAKEIAEKIADEFMKSILSRLVTETVGLRSDVDELKQSMEKVWKSIDKLTQKIEELAEAQRKTEERLNSLATKIEELAEAQRRTEENLNSLVGEIANIWGELIETKVVMDLSTFLSKRGFDVFHHFPNVPFIDVVVETDSFVAAIEICKKCDVRDVEQVVKGANILKKKEGIIVDALIVFSYTGEVDEKAVKEAKKRGVIIESSTRKLVKKLLELKSKKDK